MDLLDIQDDVINNVLNKMYERHKQDKTVLIETYIQKTYWTNADWPDEPTRIVEIMKKNGLIEMMGQSGVCVLTEQGKTVVESGGWIKYKLSKMSDDEKMHRLLEFMNNNDDQYEWTPVKLMPAFSNFLNEHEIQYLCQLLIDNNDVNDLKTKDGFAIGFIQKSKVAFYSKKYLKTKNPIQVRTGDTINQRIEIRGSTIHGGINQSSDSSDNKKNNVPVKAAINTTKRIIIGLLIGIGGGVLAGLILYYGFGIGI